jgi:two-component system sensor histidine kinase BarA
MNGGPSTRRRILWAGLLPLFLFATILAAYLLATDMRGNREYFERQGAAQAREVAAASHYGLFLGDMEELRRVAWEAAKRDHVHALEIADSEDRLLVRTVSPRHRESGQPRLLHFEEVVYSRAVPLMDAALADDTLTPADPDPAMLTRMGVVRVTLTTREMLRQHLVAVANSAAIILAGLMLALALLWRASRQIATPIEEITGVVRRAAQGDFTQRARIGSTGELARLGQGVNAMMDALQEHHGELRRRIDAATATLQQRNAELDKARQVALQASRVKSEFLAQMSHEIRTPMNGIVGFVELLGKTPLEPAQQSQVEFIRQSARQLLAIINQILDFSRIEAGVVVMAQEPFDLRELATAVYQLLTPQAAEKGLECSLAVSNQVPTALIGDPLRLRQILSNLLSNAIKYTDHGAVRVSIDADALPGALCGLTIAVEDTGIGIPETQLETIFEPFTQGNAGSRWHYEGTGLGLAIVKRLVDGMNADIDVRSSPGEGSRFRVRLRLPVAIGAVEPLRTGKEAVRMSDRRLAGLRILAVDDNRINRHLLEAMLAGHGAEVCLAESGADAIEQAQRQAFDVILMDIHMPGISGLEATRRIRRLTGYADVPILALSADAVSKSLIERELPEIDGYLIKPVEEQRLVHAIEDRVPRTAAGEHREAARSRGGPTDSGGMTGQTDPVRRLVREQLPLELHAIDTAFANGDGHALREHLHSLKGAAAVCALEELYQRICAVQEAVRLVDTPMVETGLAELHRTADRVLAELA